MYMDTTRSFSVVSCCSSARVVEAALSCCKKSRARDTPKAVQFNRRFLEGGENRKGAAEVIEEHHSGKDWVAMEVASYCSHVCVPIQRYVYQPK
jgi:hypothetical protein